MNKIQTSGVTDLRAPWEPALWKPVDPQAPHEQMHLAPPDVDASAVPQLGGDAQRAVGAA